MENLWERPVVLETHLEFLGPKRRGKVRDIYDLGDKLLLVATDRISAFDVILPDGIPGKGYVLTQLSAFWFEWLEKIHDIVSHHLISTDIRTFPESCSRFKKILSSRSMLVKKARPLPVECIVRGYLSGSGWKEYRETGRVCGEALPTGLQESDRLPEPIFTPSTKATQGHDVNIAFERMKKMIGEGLADEVRKISLKLYQQASAHAESRGIIIADTKFEFGLNQNTQQLMVIDEILTPDSSRFWPKDAYVPGGPQPSFDKQYVRDYLDSIGWNHKPPTPNLPGEVIRQTSLRYREALERLIPLHPPLEDDPWNL
jgi:phosphoribosylaminoimidazole-succinocarboxamide synthase